jgi:uncharacterized protein DUF6894
VGGVARASPSLRVMSYRPEPTRPEAICVRAATAAHECWVYSFRAHEGGKNAMARYFFQVGIEDRLILDREGRELANMHVARARALDLARRMLAGGAIKRSQQAAFHIVANPRGLPFTVAFEEAEAQAN